MDAIEYNEFLKQFFYDHIDNHIGRVRSRFSRFRFDHELEFRAEELVRAIRAVRFIQQHARDDAEIPSSFTQEMLRSTVGGVEQGVEFNNQLLETEIVDAIQDYFGEIVDGMSVDHFPPEDLRALERAGSSNPRRELTALIRVIKSRKNQIIQDGREVPFAKRLEQASKQISAIRESIPEEAPRRNKDNNAQLAPRRAVFKGIGSIGEGALLGITDVTLVAGVWTIALPVEATSVGAVVSIASGIGKILTGIGELRGE